MSTDLPSYDQMGSEAKSLLGVFLDFNGVSREKIAMTWPRSAKASAANDHPASDSPGDAGPTTELIVPPLRTAYSAAVATSLGITPRFVCRLADSAAERS